MALAFLSQSRSFDSVRNAVRFVGHDGMFQVLFFIEAGALAKSDAALQRTEPSETRWLSSFDALRNSIQHVAHKAYSCRRRAFYTPTAAENVPC
ncbi:MULTISPECIES: DUF1488 domain-containing protein [unclassified Rhizobium]|uniref:DUF1488 domain-containing protein n=1 Tax=unclassified Rhizobium TaxID=2613769 RepID=UPI001A9901A6|nr:MULTISPECIES: DUF1488 domain-containing protein [unclassified Rhizobium]MBX5157208.1 DUF1488 domain-containing protein [Rhizobium sp. NZLR8]MBX5169073.1 DUF1488 domain-containing protein [Rhizobium sp. NZLR1b]MBX5202775.1 DUF1488 domain-containing protein [Rhizobium sp. NZLR1]QSZ22309.1 DUF1488 domain-containing protein [Rhizobium sp. NZLR1]